ncbi:hypothetical protein OC834_007570 [Tilletia horrida]|uniref:Uncharacterized protein n=1 Tax=Tilletia horrida TaxID=155126 RepID=A0AAN6JHQ6_9BASI|nr:hypothetical protein OC834_007570 [Tilletia horrida]KAK0522708.1 hypothetical protein OC842_006388 [Tilletia horrida]KAK0558252.1 hypothetical protein OC844_005303 [Tilletia horrida]
MSHTQSPASGRFIKWPTHLGMTTDVDLTPVRSENYLHFLEASFFDGEDTPVDGELSIWGRAPPEEAAYIMNQVSMSTHPLKFAVADAICLRQIPKEIDGSDQSAPCLPNCPPWVTGVAVVFNNDARRKEGYLVGFVFMGRAVGFVRFKILVKLEDIPRFHAWYLAPPRSLVSFEGILHNIDSDGTPVVHLRRMTYICDAPRPLLQELGIGQSPGADRAAKRADHRQASRAKRSRTDKDTELPGDGGDHVNDASSVAGPSTPTGSPTKSGVKKSPGKMGPPSSPTVGLLTRKRSRADHV